MFWTSHIKFPVQIEEKEETLVFSLLEMLSAHLKKTENITAKRISFFCLSSDQQKYNTSSNLRKKKVIYMLKLKQLWSVYMLNCKFQPSLPQATRFYLCRHNLFFNF